MKLLKIVQALLPVITQLVKDLADDGKIDAAEREAIVVAAAMKIAEVIAILLEPEAKAEQ